MRAFIALAGLLLLACPARGQVERFTLNQRGADTSSAVPQTPHPAVVRVVVPNRDGVSYGSGTLVDANEECGLVVTNWHVVQDAAQPISVIFPDGFRSAAQLLKVDRDWDLAALVTARPRALPVRVSAAIPRAGEILTIAGYGIGNYRASSGRCTQYLSPGPNLPYEIVEVEADARQGDSGGPIFNASGELAGVLFGEAHGRTSGSYCGRVHQFLKTLAPPAMPVAAFVSASPQRNLPPTAASMNTASMNTTASNTTFSNTTFSNTTASNTTLPAAESSFSSLVESEPEPAADLPLRRGLSGDLRAPEIEVAASASSEGGWHDLIGHTLWDRVKSGLAVVGVLSLLLSHWRRPKPAPRSEPASLPSD